MDFTGGTPATSDRPAEAPTTAITRAPCRPGPTDRREACIFEGSRGALSRPASLLSRVAVLVLQILFESALARACAPKVGARDDDEDAIKVPLLVHNPRGQLTVSVSQARCLRPGAPTVREQID